MRVSEEDYVFVPAGTLHSLQAGSLVYEIEEICDFTYRFYDYDRIDAAGNKRPLHTGKALSAIEVGNAGEVKRYQPGCEIVERYYATKLLENQAYYHNESNCIECLTVLSGALEIDGDSRHNCFFNLLLHTIPGFKNHRPADPNSSGDFRKGS